MRINSPYITGSATITGNLCVQGTITGTITGVASTASYAETLDGLDSTQFVQTGSFNSYTSSASSSLGDLSGSVATTTLNLSSSLSGSIGGLSGSVATTTSNLSSSIGSVSSSVATTTLNLSSSIGSLSGSVAITTFNLSSSIGGLSSSVATTTSGLGGRITTIEGRYATTGSNIFVGSQTITGSLYITTDLVVQGCSCLQNITASAVSIGTNTVVLNTATPAVRFAGISVQDSGSNAGVTGSIYWDGLCNRWIYSNPTGIGYSGGMLLSGPRTSTLGTESPLTCNYISKSGGGDHLYDSCIIDDGTTVCVNANLKVSGQVCGLMGTFSCVGIGTSTPSTKLQVVGSIKITDNPGVDYIGFGAGNTSAKYSYITSTSEGAQKVGLAIYTTCDAGTTNQERVRITDLGNVGIGCTSPTYHLEVRCAASTSSCYLAAMFARSTGAADGVGDIIAFGANGVSSIAGIYRTSGSWGLELQTANQNTRMRIDNGGNIGIGTLTPGTKLEISSTAADADRTLPHNVLTITALQTQAPYGPFGGSILFKNSSYVSGVVCSARIRSVIYDDGAPANCGGGLWFETTPTPGGTLTPSLVIDYQGRVGIRCSSPGAQLVVYGACNGDTTLHVQNGSVSGKITFSNNTANAIYGGGWYGYMGYNSATYHYFGQCIVAPNLRVQSAFADLTLCGTNTSSPHLGGTFSITTNQDGNGRTIIGNNTVGRAMYLEANGNVTFNCTLSATVVNAGSCFALGAIGHYQNYRNTSGCFAIFCASQGAILYVTSMHNNGRSTAIVSYANGVTAGAAISIVNQVTPYGPASLGFGVCANGWVYGYAQYGGPMDFYAISMNSNFAWGF